MPYRGDNEYLSSLLGAEAHFSMQLEAGIWKVNESTIGTANSLNSTTNLSTPSTPGGHLHINIPELEGKQITYKYSYNGVLRDFGTGTIIKNGPPSGLDRNGWTDWIKCKRPTKWR